MNDDITMSVTHDLGVMTVANSALVKVIPAQVIMSGIAP